MWQGQADPNKMTQSELKIRYMLMQKELELKDSIIFQRDQELTKVNSELLRHRSEVEQREDALEKRVSEISDLKIQFEVTKVKLTQAQSELVKKRSIVRSMILAASISVLFGVTTIMFNLGNSMITTTPPNAQGNTLLIIAVIVYLVATVVNIINSGKG
jgi:hypothetical protein